jgi:hypothetical protein
MNIAVAALVIFWTIPIQFALGLANLTNLAKIPGISFLVGLFSINAAIKGFIEGLLPSLVVIAFFELVVPLLRLITRGEYVRVQTSSILRKAPLPSSI